MTKEPAMPFDKAAFHALVKERFQVAANPTFKPIPDETIADPEARDRLHRTALERAEDAREAAIADVAAHAGAMLVSSRLPELWPAGATDGTFDWTPIAERLRASLEGGDADALEDAALLLLIMGFARLVKE
jgi:hypothetical protein